MGIFDRIKIYNQMMDEKKEEAKKRLKRDSKGKPIIKLTPLEKTVVHTPTQQDYNTLMQIYESGGWIRNGGGRLPTSFNSWSKQYKGETCVEVRRIFGYSRRDYFQSEGYEILSTQDFYKKQKITKSMIKEIKDYFKNKNPKKEE